MGVHSRLEAMGIVLPCPATAIANYVPTKRTAQNLVFVSGQLPLIDGVLHRTGRVGDDVSIEEAYAAARQCGINLLAQIARELDGELERITGCIKVTAFIACVPDFTDHPKVANGASDILVGALGEDRGRHSRSAVGVASLPLNAPVEIEAIFEIAG